MKEKAPSRIPVNGDRATIRLRDGTVHHNQNVERWKKALAGHSKDAHKGKILATCPACTFLSARADGGK